MNSHAAKLGTAPRKVIFNGMKLRRHAYCVMIISAACLLLGGRFQSTLAAEAAPLMIEAETAEPAAGLTKDSRPAASKGLLLGVHSDRQKGIVCRWNIALDKAQQNPDLHVRYASDLKSSFAVVWDGAEKGVIMLPATNGWGHKDREWKWVAAKFNIGELPEGKHTLELRAMPGSGPINLDCLMLGAVANPNAIRLILGGLGAPATSASVDLQEFAPPAGEAESFVLGAGKRKDEYPGLSWKTVSYFSKEFLPALFERTLLLEEFNPGGGSLEWIFNGDHGGVTVAISSNSVMVSQRFYDSFGLPEGANGRPAKAQRHPEKIWLTDTIACKGALRAVTVAFDNPAEVAVSLNGKEALRRRCAVDVNSHQLRLSDARGAAQGKIIRPLAKETEVRIIPTKAYQTMMGFGGITPPPAYAMLSPEGKRRWWEIVAEYNLLIQREYPTGRALNKEMTNWESLDDAWPHYYADNFPNGEASNFTYNKLIKRLGGKVWFEFWLLPLWAGTKGPADTKSHADPEAYTRAMLGYCKASVEKAGAPPDVMGIQNENSQPAEIYKEMTLTLRRELDRAGFKGVKIHLSDPGTMSGGIKRAQEFKSFKEVWDVIDYVATHEYDYQNHFANPDRFDETMARWKAVVEDKPFLATEICINNNEYQLPGYRVALALGELYHKNLAILDAQAVIYCWTLLNVVEPSYGWTRTLFVPDAAQGFTPAPSSYQLRVYGAFSRRIKEGMKRIAVENSDADLMATAYQGDAGAMTVVLLNRSTAPRKAKIQGGGAAFKWLERADPYNANAVEAAPAPTGGVTEATIPAGGIITLTNVPLGHLPDGFLADIK
ncbi:MAG: hypothetical protein NTX50_20375 [Candidatus Sumerlaeota bacterium]|nr:hypothetical protein [Candidatus Sumerlaeota bacterium]